MIRGGANGAKKKRDRYRLWREPPGARGDRTFVLPVPSLATFTSRGKPMLGVPRGCAGVADHIAFA
jgi:hypothetical protein